MTSRDGTSHKDRCTDQAVDKLIEQVSELHDHQAQFKRDIERLEHKIDDVSSGVTGMIAAWEAVGWLGSAIKAVAAVIAAFAIIWASIKGFSVPK